LCAHTESHIFALGNQKNPRILG